MVLIFLDYAWLFSEEKGLVCLGRSITSLHESFAVNT